ncbi:MAG TPA: hypothetical protein VIX42_07880 [Edaphobacter sp.]
MTQASQSGSSNSPRAIGGGYLFGVPVGDLGWFASLLIGTTAGFAAFFATTFCGIFAILIYNSLTHRAVDYAVSYRFIGLPVGVVTLILAYVYLGILWVKRLGRR